MIVNIISDIHADYDIETNKVIYNAPYNFAVSKICDAVSALKGYFAENIANLRKMPFDNEYMNSMFDVPYITNVEQMADWIAALEREVHLACIGLNSVNVFVWSRLLTSIEDFFRKNHIPWEYKKIDLDDIRQFLFKLMFDFDPKKLKSADILIIAGDLGYVNTYFFCY